MILVVGATGMMGGEVCSLLAEKGMKTRALVRTTADAAKVERLRALGAEIVTGDLRDRASLDAACQGAAAVICTASAMPFAYVPESNTPINVDRDGIIALVDAAREQHVNHFVHTSFAPLRAEFPLQDAKRAVEARLRSSGMNYTILQPTYFMELWLSPAVGFDYTARKASIFGEGQNAISWISYRDVAKFAVAALTTPGAGNATMELGGPQALTPLEVVGIFEKAGGQAWEYVNVPTSALEAQVVAADEPMQKSFAGLMLSLAYVTPIDMTATLRNFPITLGTVEDYAQQVSAGAPAVTV
jgi:uncharacterized protein YbjT (DUF2867 family)